MFGKGEESAGFKNAESLPKEALAVRHIHRHVLCVNAVKRVIFLHEPLAITKLEGSLFRQADKLCKPLRSIDKGSGNIDADDPASVASCDIASRAADTTANIKDPMFGSDV